MIIGWCHLTAHAPFAQTHHLRQALAMVGVISIRLAIGCGAITADH